MSEFENAVVKDIRRTTYDNAYRHLCSAHVTASQLGLGECVRCGLCCKICPGRMTYENVVALASRMGLPIKETFQKYLMVDVQEDAYYVLPIKADLQHVAGSVISDEDTWSLEAPCIFFDATTNNCMLHGDEAKPLECSSGLACSSVYTHPSEAAWTPQQLLETFGINLE